MGQTYGREEVGSFHYLGNSGRMALLSALLSDVEQRLREILRGEGIPSRWIVGRDQLISGADLSQAATEDLLSILLENRHRTGAAESAVLPRGGIEAGGCMALQAAQEPGQ